MRTLPAVVLISALLAGCASTQYVDDRAAATDGRIEALARRVSELGQSQAADRASQEGRINRLGQEISALGSGQEGLAARLAAWERSDAERQGIMANLTARLNQQEDRQRQGEAAGRQALDLATGADKGLEALRQRVLEAERVQAGQQTALHAQKADMAQLLERLQGNESVAAQAMAQAGWADSRGAVADNRAGQAATLAREALDLAKSLQARLEGLAAPQSERQAAASESPRSVPPSPVDEEARRMAHEALAQAGTALERNAASLARLEAMPTPPPAGDATARQLAEEAAAQARRAIGLLESLQTRVDTLTQAAPTPQTVLPVAVHEHMTQSEQRLTRIEGHSGEQGKRLVALETGLEQTGAQVRKVEERATGLAESGTRLDQRMEKNEGLLIRLEGQVQEARDRLQGQDTALAQTSAMAREALERAMAAGQLAQGKFLYEVVLSEDKFHFGLNSAELTPESMAALDDLVLRLNAQNANVYLEIQGHTDTSGPSQANLALAKRRALAVRDYLKLKGQVPLHRMSVIALGDSQPAASNDNRAGRKQNRRVVIEVLR